MDKILFSLPVHERPDMVRDLIENLNYFCPDSKIILHVSSLATADKDEFRRECDFENVIINPHSYETIWSTGIMHTHVSNFLHAMEIGESFDKIMMISTNELLVKHGLREHVSRFELGAQTEVYDGATDWGVFKPNFLDSPQMQGFLQGLGLPLFFGGQAEGQFFSQRIFHHLAVAFTSNFPMGPFGFPLEEVIPATIAARYCITGTDAALPVTLCDYCTNLKITEDVIDQVRRGTGTLFAKRIPRALRSPHIGQSTLKDIYSVKRIPREDCDLRRYVRSLMTAEAN